MACVGLHVRPNRVYYRSLVRFYSNEKVKKTGNGDDNNKLKLFDTPINFNKLPSYGDKIRSNAIDGEKDVWQALKNTWTYAKTLDHKAEMPRMCDILIIGGGIIGTLTVRQGSDLFNQDRRQFVLFFAMILKAVFLRMLSKQLNVVVVERDLDVRVNWVGWMANELPNLHIVYIYIQSTVNRRLTGQLVAFGSSLV
jgi:hypothetical protein